MSRNARTTPFKGAFFNASYSFLHSVLFGWSPLPSPLFFLFSLDLHLFPSPWSSPNMA